MGNCFHDYSFIYINHIRRPRHTPGCISRQSTPSRPIPTLLLDQPHLHIYMLRHGMEQIHTPSEGASSNSPHWKATRYTLPTTPIALGYSTHLNVRTATLAPISINFSRSPGIANTRRRAVPWIYMRMWIFSTESTYFHSFTLDTAACGPVSSFKANQHTSPASATL
jgi:hypothetical protein